jgi:translation initiation factor 2 gamma subunit (eIF-2gamma)
MGGQLTFKDFQETIIPTQKMELVNIKKEEFEEFGEVKEMTGTSVASSSPTIPATVSEAPKRLGAGAAK